MKEIKLPPNHIKPKLVHNEPLTGCQDGWVHILSFVPIEVGDTLTSIKDYFMFARGKVLEVENLGKFNYPEGSSVYKVRI